MSIGCRTLYPQMNEENKQGIVSILGISGDGYSEKRLKTEYPLRRSRTLSADMSSKKFLALHDPASPSMKKIASSGAIPTFSSTPESDEEDNEENRASQSDIWNLIQSQKPAIPTAQPYVHPLVRRSSSSLSSKSLELCTESLGSETGSEFCFSPPSPTASFFSSLPPSPSSEAMEEEGGGEEGLDFLFGGEADRRKGNQEIDEEKWFNYNCTISRRSPARSFPPPLPSISRRDGPRLHMKPHRQDGRLVLQAVALPSHNYLQAQRQGGRLLLSFIPTPQQQKQEEEAEEEEEEEEEDEEVAVEEEGDAEVIEDEEEEQGEEREEEGEEIVNSEGAEEAREEGDEGEKEAEEEELEKRLEVVGFEMWRSKGPAVIELHRSIGKLISQPFININPWAQKKKLAADTAAAAAAEERERELAAHRLNRYERCWKGGGLGEGKVVGAKELVRGLVPRRCNEPRRAHPVWILERRCVATT
ncbi:protein FAF-like, chloroplastic [Nymphaea colorata]|uniref:FAF domain-containing protein n=1 Tax=Nymphaea colorata TaxID=210225 RepID=A0A5K0WJV6_9MAGN|nr:protein FAF-like, chloroplastic [Nymphaea colorata]